MGPRALGFSGFRVSGLSGFSGFQGSGFWVLMVEGVGLSWFQGFKGLQVSYRPRVCMGE